MRFIKGFVATILLFCGCLAMKDIDRAYFADWSQVMDDKGLTWEPHQVKTEDGWFLTIFRITGEVGSDSPNFKQKEN